MSLNIISNDYDDLDIQPLRHLASSEFIASVSASMVNRDSGTRRASRLAVQFDVGELCFHRSRS